jgi:hypothetical protein
MRVFLIAASLFLLTSTAQASFAPLTTAQRISAAKVIVVIKIEAVDYLKGVADAKVVTGIFGAKAGEMIKVWSERRVGKDGKEWYIGGRNPYFEKGKTYFIYLSRNEKGRLVTVQSSLDSLEVTSDQVDKEGGEGSESLVLKIKRTRELIAKTPKAQQAVTPDR